MRRHASASAFEAAENATDDEREARARAAEIVSGFRAARAALSDAEQAYVVGGLDLADKHLAAAGRAIDAIRAQRSSIVAVALDIARAGAGR